uniref:Insulin-like domain-containing protein n=1 Tax=Chelonoidis abingdonii TaxID=106734 RepID=A0A8C0GCJ7_CHEAB
IHLFCDSLTLHPDCVPCPFLKLSLLTVQLDAALTTTVTSIPAIIMQPIIGVLLRLLHFFPNNKTLPFVLCAGKPTGYGSSSRRLHHKGIVDECCFQSCDLRRLEMYCAPIKPPKSARSVRAQRHTDMPKAQREVHLKNSSRGNTGNRNYKM